MSGSPPPQDSGASETSSGGPRRGATWLALGPLIALGLALRLIGVGFLLPQRVAPDSLVLENEVRLLLAGDPDLEREHAYGLYPHLIPRLALFAPPPEQTSAPASLSEHLSRAAWLRRNIRIVVALLSLFLVPATWLLARRFLEPAWALLAAGFVAASFLHVWFAQQGRPHSAAASFVLLAVVSSLALRRDPSWRAFVFAGLSTALAVGALQSGIFTFAPFLAAVLLRERRPGEGGGRMLARTLTALVLVLLLLPAFYPFLLDGKPHVGAGSPDVEGSILNLSGHRVSLDLFNGAGFRVILHTLWAYEPILLVLASCGVVLAIARFAHDRRSLDSGRMRDLLVVLAHALPYLGVIALYQNTYQRFVIPLVPYAAVLAAYALFRASRAVRPRLASAAIVLVPFAAQVTMAARLASIRAAPDTITRAADWVRHNVQPERDRILLSPALDLPVLQSLPALQWNWRLLGGPTFPWTTYQRELPPGARAERGYDLVVLPVHTDAEISAFERDPDAFVRDLGAGWAVVEVREGWSWPGFATLRATLQRAGSRVARFSPDSPDRPGDYPLDYQGEGLPERIPWMWRVLRARCTGPVIEIYRIAP